jgi:hypothetical protein
MHSIDSGRSRALVIAAVIAGGLALDQHLESWGQVLTNCAVWALYLHWLQRADAPQRLGLTVCVLYATLGEIFLSLVWGLYEYRLAGIPLFVPPGHALLFMLGSIIAARVKDWITWAVPLATAPFIALALGTGTGTLDAVLFVLFVLCLRFGRAPRLYAVMFVLALAMEILGTRLGNWTWNAAVPWLSLTALNPPLAAGAFYCVLDLLIVATVARVRTGAASARALVPSR